MLFSKILLTISLKILSCWDIVFLDFGLSAFVKCVGLTLEGY